jgi:MFS family permease
VVVRPWAGRVGDRLGRRVLMVSGPVLVGLSVASYHVVAASVPSLAVARLVGGIGEAAMFVGAGTMITDLSPEHRRGEALSYWSVAIYGGLAFGPALGELVLGEDRAFGRVWTLCAGLCLGAAALALATRETLVTAPPATGGSGRTKAPLLHRATLLPGLVLFLVMVGLAGFTELLPLYVTEVHLRDSKAVFLAYGITVLAVRILGARIPDRIGSTPAATAATLISAAGLALMAAGAHPVGLFAGTIVFALGMSLLFPAIVTLSLSGVPPHERGSVVGTVSTFFDASQGVGAALMGGLAALAGYRGAFAGGAVSCLVGCALLRTRVARRPTGGEAAEGPSGRGTRMSVPDDDAVAAAVVGCDPGHL